MRPKLPKTPKPRAPRTPPKPEIGVDGLPILRVTLSTGIGVCGTCLMSAKVGIHKRGGYYSVCRHCGTRVFTSTPEGTMTFRAMQHLLQDQALLNVLKDVLGPEVQRLAVEMTEGSH